MRVPRSECIDRVGLGAPRAERAMHAVEKLANLVVDFGSSPITE